MSRQLTWIPGDPAADPILLTNKTGGHTTLKGVTGLGAPAVELLTEVLPLLDGAQVLDEYAPPRLVQIPMTVHGATPAEFQDRLAVLADALDPVREGELELAQRDGSRFRLRARYQSGLEGDESIDLGGDVTWYRFVLTLYVGDPFWYDPTPVTLDFPYATASNFFPILPVLLSSSQVLGGVTISNPGTVTSWPTWTITGPGTGATLTNDTTGQSLTLGGSGFALAAGQELIIRTRPGAQQIALADGTDWWHTLTGNPVFWGIPPGDTQVSLAVAGATTGTVVRLSFERRHRHPWVRA